MFLCRRKIFMRKKFFCIGIMKFWRSMCVIHHKCRPTNQIRNRIKGKNNENRKKEVRQKWTKIKKLYLIVAVINCLLVLSSSGGNELKIDRTLPVENEKKINLI